MNSTTHPSYHEELAAHLDSQAAPQPHPRTYQHGYPKGGQRPVATATTARQWDIELEQARKEAEQAADARMRELGLADETEGADELISGSRTGGRLLVAYMALAFLGLVVGFVRGCAS